MKHVKSQVSNPIPLDMLKKTRVYKIMERLNATNQIDRGDADFIVRWINNNAIFNDAVPYFGWRFDFASFMSIYEVRLKEGTRTLYGFDKTSIRNSLDVEIEDKDIILIS